MGRPSRSRELAPFAALATVVGVTTTVGPLADDAISDLFVYRTYAEGVLDRGLSPYGDLGFEYPPLALGPILAARVPSLPGSLGLDAADTYAVTFGVLMLVAALAVQAGVLALGGRRAAWALVVLLPLAGALLRTRLDLVPVALLLAGLVLVARGRTAVGMGVLAVGTATKLFPAIAAAFVVAHLVGAGRLHAAARGTAAFAAVLAVVCLPFAGDGFLDQFRFHLDRPVQIESTPATVLWALDDSFVTGHPVRPDRFKSNGLDGGPADVVAALFAAGLVAALALVAALVVRARGAPLALDRGVLAGLLAFVALGKVLSPQYLIWLLPLAALAWVRGDRAVAALVASAAALAHAWFPGRYFDLVTADGIVVGLVAVRNALLLAALVLAVRALALTSREAAPTGRGSARSRPRAAAATP